MNLPLAAHPLRLRLAAALPVMLALAACVTPARAETYDTCTGFIDSLPAVLTSQGVWCLRGDLSTAMTSGNAIEIANNNVTLDCNGFKIGGLAAGDSSSANGVYAYNRQNASIRNCSIRGFYKGIRLHGGTGTQAGSAGHVVEDNRLDNNLHTGIEVTPGHGHLVRRNRVFDTGGAPNQTYASGIYANADVVDNLVDGLFATATNGYPRAISVYGGGHIVQGNIVRGFVVTGTGEAWGVYMGGDGNRASGNHVYLEPTGAGVGIRTGTGTINYCSDNTIGGFATSMDHCMDAGSNHGY